MYRSAPALDRSGRDAPRNSVAGTGRGLLFVAAALVALGLVVGLVANLGILISGLLGAVLGLEMVALHFWLGRGELVKAATEARGAEELARRDAAESRFEADRLSPFESRATDQTRELEAIRGEQGALLRSLAGLRTEIASLRTRAETAESQVAAETRSLEELRSRRDAAQRSLTDAQAEIARLQSLTAAADSQSSFLVREVQQLNVELNAERNATARAPFLPELRPTVEVEESGGPGPPRFAIKVENLGRGNARNVQVSWLLGGAGQLDRLIQGEVVPLLAPGESHLTKVGGLDELAGAQWLEAQLHYESQFGPCDPVVSRRAL